MASADPTPAASRPLGELLERGRAAVKAAAGAGGEPGAAREALEELEAAAALVEARGLFSANEEAEDVPTASLRYLLVPYLRAALLDAVCAAMPARLPALRQARALLREFLLRLARYGLGGAALPAGDLPDDDDDGGADGRRPTREEKIRRRRQRRELEARLGPLAARRQKARPPRRPAAGGEEEEEEAAAAAAPDWGEEEEREFWRLKLEAAALDALDRQRLVAEEVGLLQARRDAPEPPAPDPRAAQERQQTFDALKHAASVLGNDEERLRRGVFRVSGTAAAGPGPPPQPTLLPRPGGRASEPPRRRADGEGRPAADPHAADGDGGAVRADGAGAHGGGGGGEGGGGGGGGGGRGGGPPRAGPRVRRVRRRGDDEAAAVGRLQGRQPAGLGQQQDHAVRVKNTTTTTATTTSRPAGIGL